MSNLLVARIQQAFAGIPHDRACGEVCDCDREARIAQRVAASWQAFYEMRGARTAYYKSAIENAALAALGAAPGEEKP